VTQRNFGQLIFMASETLDAVIFDIADFGDPSNSHPMAKDKKKWSIIVHLRVSQQEWKQEIKCSLFLSNFSANAWEFVEVQIAFQQIFYRIFSKFYIQDKTFSVIA